MGARLTVAIREARAEGAEALLHLGNNRLKVNDGLSEHVVGGHLESG
jgi:hypothetical protein